VIHRLTNWRVVRVTNAEILDEVTLHAVGTDADTGEGRVSGPLDAATVEWNGFFIEMASKSGGIYLLLGPPDWFEKALDIWSTFTKNNQLMPMIGKFEDVSNEIPPGVDYFKTHEVAIGVVCPSGAEYACYLCQEQILPGNKFSAITDWRSNKSECYCWFCRSFDHL